MTYSILVFLSFQFTTSQGGRLYRHVFKDTDRLLSIHDLTRRSTRKWCIHRVIFRPFNSRPHKEVDALGKATYDAHKTFNSRPHKEVDYTNHMSIYGFIIFQFTTSQGGRPCRGCRDPSVKPFNSRPHKEVDQYDWLGKTLLPSFNSRPHKEVDVNPDCDRAYQGAFQFTTSQGGRPYIFGETFLKLSLSIHDLTRRSTVYKVRQPCIQGAFNSRPHKEVDSS